MMEHNEQEYLTNLNIITTDNRTINFMVDGVIPGSSSNIIPEKKLDTLPDHDSSPYIIPSKSDKIIIGSLNVRSECNHKMYNILHKMTQHNIHILFVNELNIKHQFGENSIKNYVFKEVCYSPYNDHFKYLINADSTQNNSGCGFIIHVSLFSHIHKINCIHGRLLHITLTFKKITRYSSTNSLHIIGIYSPQIDKKYKNICMKINDYVLNFFANTPFDQHHVILGDFNVSYKKFTSKSKKSSTS